MEKGLTVGHAQAGHNPDEPALVWVDDRLLEKRVDNRGRFSGGRRAGYLKN